MTRLICHSQFSFLFAVKTVGFSYCWLHSSGPRRPLLLLPLLPARSSPRPAPTVGYYRSPLLLTWPCLLIFGLFTIGIRRNYCSVMINWETCNAWENIDVAVLLLMLSDCPIYRWWSLLYTICPIANMPKVSASQWKQIQYTIWDQYLDI